MKLITFAAISIATMVGCGRKSEDDTPPPSIDPPLGLDVNQSRSFKGRTVPNKSLPAPFSYSYTQTYKIEASAEAKLVLVENRLTRVCNGGSNFDGPAIAVSRPDGSVSKGELNANSPMLRQFQVQVLKGLNSVTLQFNADSVCDVEYEFSLKPQDSVAAANTTFDKSLVGVWSLAKYAYNSALVSNIEITPAGLWQSQVKLNDDVVSKVDYTFKTNDLSERRQVELLVSNVYKTSGSSPIKAGDVYRCIYQITASPLKKLALFCSAKGSSFFPTNFPSEGVEVYNFGAAPAVVPGLRVLNEQTDLALAVPDNSQTGATITFDVIDDVAIGDLTVAFDLQHNVPSDIRVTLIDPHGLTVNLNSTYPVVGINTYGRNGTAVPGLAQLKGLSAKGRWSLKFNDLRSGEVGIIKSISVSSFL